MTHTADLSREALCASPLFSGIAPKDARSKLRDVEFLSTTDQRVLAAEGEPAKEFFVVMRGQIEVTTGGVIEHVLRAGDWTNPLPVIARQKWDTTLTADAGSELAVINQRALITLLDILPGFARRVLTVLARDHQLVPSFPP